MDTQFVCASCGARAMRLVVTSAADPPDPGGRVRPAGFGVRAECGRFDVWTAASELGGGADSLRQAIADGDAAALARVDRELVPLYCRECAASYCIDHWTTWETYDTDYPGGWFEDLRGRCPEGHVRIIHD